MRNTFMNTVMGTCTQREDIFIITGDAGLGVFDEFKVKYRDRFLNLGVAEQNMASFCAGLAMTGHKVFLYNIIPFLIYRCYEQVRNDICYQELPVVLVGIGSGLTYAPAGMTHYSVEDIGIARTLPNLTVLSPIDPVEAKLAAEYSLTSAKPVLVRLPKTGEPFIHKDDRFDISEPQLIEDGEDIAILFHGSISLEVMKANDALRKDGINPKLISIPMVQPLNVEKLFQLLNGCTHVISVEEHFITTGFGSILAQEFIKEKPSWNLHLLGITDNFIHEIKDVNGMREYFGISGSKITEFTKRLVN